MLKWISVDEAFPSDSNLKLICYLNSCGIRLYTVGIYLDCRWIDEIGKRHTIKKQVTHWMNFPTFERIYDTHNITT